MTRESIIAKWETLTPRERDAWVATAVMGWEIRRIYTYDNCFHEYYYRDGVQYENVNYPDEWQPTKYIESTWTVVDVMADCLHLKEHGPDGEWSASFCGTGCDGASGETASLAICLAALIANLTMGALS